MNEEKIKIRAKKWAEMFIKSPAEFASDYQMAVNIGRYEANELFTIVSLAQVYENCIRGDIDRQEASERQADLLKVYHGCIAGKISVADALGECAKRDKKEKLTENEEYDKEEVQMTEERMFKGTIGDRIDRGGENANTYRLNRAYTDMRELMKELAEKTAAKLVLTLSAEEDFDEGIMVLDGMDKVMSFFDVKEAEVEKTVKGLYRKAVFRVGAVTFSGYAEEEEK